MIIETIDVAPVAQHGGAGSGRLWGASLLLVRRRAWRDRGLVLASVAIVALAALLACAGPRVVLDILDDGARDAVVGAGDDANIIVTFPVGNTSGDNVNTLRGTSPEDFGGYAAAASGNLPGIVSPLVEGYTASVLSHELAMTGVLAPVDSTVPVPDLDAVNATVHPDLWTSPVTTTIQFAMSDDLVLTVVEGRLPVDATGSDEAVDVTVAVNGEDLPRVHVPSEVIEIALTASVAEALELEVGSIVRIENNAQNRVFATVVGIVEPGDPAAVGWQQYPEALSGVTIDRPGLPIVRRGTAIVSTATATAIAAVLEQPFDGEVELRVGTTGLTLKGSAAIAEAMTTLESTANTIIPAPDVTVTMSSGLGAALEAYPARARAALAQMSIMVAGAIGVAAVVVALMARLLVGRREHDLALERARGASVASIAVRLALESAAFTTVGVVIGYVGAQALVGPLPFGTGALTLVALVAWGASPLIGILAARRMWTSRRVPANRQDRAKLAKAAMAKRLTIEALAIVVAVVAVVTLRARGVLQTQTDDIDPFLAAAPMLLALGVTVIVLRIYPLPMRAVQAVAQRTTGIAGIIALAKARARIPWLPLLGLTLAISIAVSGGLLVSTVRQGQDQASWERVGGDVRIESSIDDATVALLESQGLGVARVVTKAHVTVNLGNTSTSLYVLAIDGAYADAVAAAGIVDPADLRALVAAGDAASPSDRVPALASPDVADLAFTESQEAYLGGHYIDISVIGDALSVPSGWAEGPFMILPADNLMARDLEEPLDFTVTFVTGTGAEQSVLDAGIDPSLVTSREEWRDRVRESALIGGVERMMTLAVVAVGLLAAVALLVTVLEGVRLRGIALSMFRTQGMGSGYGWWLALTELAPLTIAAVVGGAIGGVAILVLLGRTLGLEILAGGVAPPELAGNPPFLAAVAGGVLVLLLAAVSAEVAAHRRNKLSEVLRLGETR